MYRSLRALITLSLATLLFPTHLLAQGTTRQQRQEYKAKYQHLAIKKMREHGIPASITLAQGMLESGNGRSRLAREGNNHFGIKCHKDWKGRRMYHDDDARGECFRVYRSVEQSFEDHSNFLRGARRYAFLFDLSPTDYKGWAHGLKKAGYATDPNYARLLIRIIEEEELWQLDRGVEVEIAPPRVAQRDAPATGSKVVVRLGGSRPVFVRNRVEYIVVAPHDTYQSLTRAMEMMPWELARYNELPARELPPPGTELYVQPKRRRAARGCQTHVVERGETLYSIAQKYAVKTSSLRRRNHLQSSDTALEEGQLIYLRKKAPIK